MLCEHCKKRQADVNFVGIVGGKPVALHLCNICYAEYGGKFSQSTYKPEWASLLGGDDKYEKICPVCGTTYADFERSGLLGCTSCYDVFKEELIPAIRKVQGKVQHVGKIGKNNDELGLHRRLSILQERLESALKAKRFSEADSLNRQIKSVKKILFGEGNE